MVVICVILECWIFNLSIIKYKLLVTKPFCPLHVDRSEGRWCLHGFDNSTGLRKMTPWWIVVECPTVIEWWTLYSAAHITTVRFRELRLKSYCFKSKWENMQHFNNSMCPFCKLNFIIYFFVSSASTRFVNNSIESQLSFSTLSSIYFLDVGDALDIKRAKVRSSILAAIF